MSDRGRGRRKPRSATAEAAPGAVELAAGVSLPPADRKDVLVTASVGPAGELVALWSAPETGGGRVTTHWPPPDGPHQVAPPGAVIPLEKVPEAYRFVQPLPDGRVLLVEARCAWRGGDPERNAAVHDAAGRRVHEATLGDGIQHVQAASSGQVWVGYFDEGVYGNYGWGGPGPLPLGSPGLVRYTAGLERDWEYPSGSPGVPPIDDCYALNVTDDAVWACYYSGFPLVRVRGGEVTVWRHGVGGVTALAVDGRRVALAGGYRPNHDRLALVELDGGSARVAGTFRLTLPGGDAVPRSARLVGRGAVLHVISEGLWYRLPLADLDGHF